MTFAALADGDHDSGTRESDYTDLILAMDWLDDQTRAGLLTECGLVTGRRDGRLPVSALDRAA